MFHQRGLLRLSTGAGRSGCERRDFWNSWALSRGADVEVGGVMRLGRGVVSRAGRSR